MSRIIATGLVIAIVFTALSYGTVEPWSIAGFCLLITALLVLWAIQAIYEKRFSLQLYPLLLPPALFVFYSAVQSIAFVQSDGTTSSLSRDVEATRNALPVIFCLFVAFVLASQVFNTPKQLGNLVAFLTFYGLALAVFALVQYLTWEGKFYWLRPTKGTAFGPFVNRNHFAGYIEMLIPLPVAMIVARSIRKDLWLLYGFAALMMTVAVVVSLSRGGMISVAAGLLFMAILKSRLGSNTEQQPVSAKRTQGVSLKRAAAALAIMVLLLAGTIWLGAEQVLQRAANTLGGATTTQEDFLSRSWIWHDTGAMIRTHAIFGVGVGAYEKVFPIYGSNTSDYIVVTHSHNDYLQALADMGLIGGAMVVWFLILLFRAMWQSVRSPDLLLAGVALGCSGGVFAMLVHSFFDFNLQIPSNALLFLMLSAILAHLAARVRQPEETVEKAAALRGQSRLRSKEVMQYGWRRFRSCKQTITGFLIVFLLSFASLSYARQDRSQPQLKPKSQAPGAPNLSNEVLISPDEDYRIGPSDIIEIQVQDAPDLCKQHRVSALGNIRIGVSFMKKLNVLNKTTEEVETVIADGLRGRYLKNPQVFVSVVQPNSKIFFVQGAVRAPGHYRIEGRPTLIKLISAAGGLADSYGSTAFIYREIKEHKETKEAEPGEAASPKPTQQPAAENAGTNEQGPADKAEYELLSVNINKFNKGQIKEASLYLQSGDIIIIPPTDVFFVAGEVQHPGEFSLKEGTTLRQAISLAQGTTFNAAAQRGVIFREEGKERVEKKINISDVMNGKAPDIPIMANDIIIVPNSKMKTVANSLLKAFGVNSARLPVVY